MSRKIHYFILAVYVGTLGCLSGLFLLISRPDYVTSIEIILTPAPTATVTPIPVPTSVMGDDVPMITIPAGAFLMGSTAAEIGRWEPKIEGALDKYRAYIRDEWPQMLVYLDEYEIDQYEVTYERYQRCVDDGICSALAEVGLPQHPVNTLHEEAKVYCEWTSKRLPTEAEWEKAARGSNGQLYPWGNEWDESRLHLDCDPTEVGSYPDGASPYGVLDMAGSVSEWIGEPYKIYPEAAYTAPPWDILEHPLSRRGRDCASSLRPELHPDITQRVADRYRALPYERYGFRCVRGSDPVPLERSLVTIPGTVVQPPPRTADLSRMVWIPAGAFQTGRTEPISESKMLYLPGFYIDPYETTNRDYVEFLNELGETYFACGGVTCLELKPPEDAFYRRSYPTPITREGHRFVVDAGFENHPIGHLSRAGAEAYCRWRGKRLPTGEEWEKAARGVDGDNYPWGNVFDEDSEKKYAKWLVSPVGSYPEDVSPYGLWDVYGNVAEWVSDWSVSGNATVEFPDAVARPSGDLVSNSPRVSWLPIEKTGVRCAY